MLALAMVGVMMLISSVIFGGVPALVTPLLAALVFVVFWVLLPLRAHRRKPKSD